MSQQPNPNSSPEDNAWAQPENTSQGASASGSTGAGTSAGAGSSTGTESSDSNSWTERIEVASEQVIDTLKKLISEGNVRRVTLRKSNGKKLISVPMTAGAAIGGVAVLAAPHDHSDRRSHRTRHQGDSRNRTHRRSREC